MQSRIARLHQKLIDTAREARRTTNNEEMQAFLATIEELAEAALADEDEEPTEPGTPVPTVQ